MPLAEASRVYRKSQVKHGLLNRALGAQSHKVHLAQAVLVDCTLLLASHTNWTQPLWSERLGLLAPFPQDPVASMTMIGWKSGDFDSCT